LRALPLSWYELNFQSLPAWWTSKAASEPEVVQFDGCVAIMNKQSKRMTAWHPLGIPCSCCYTMPPTSRCFE